MVGLEATARTDSSCNIMAQRMKDIAHMRATYVPPVFLNLCRESRFHLFKGFLQKGLFDKRIAESSFKVTQSLDDSRGIFQERLRVDRFVAQMGQTFRSTVGDQFLDRRLWEEKILSVPGNRSG